VKREIITKEIKETLKETFFTTFELFKIMIPEILDLYGQRQ